MNLQTTFPKVFFGNRIQAGDACSIQIGDGSCVGSDVWFSTCFADASIVIGKSVLVGRRSVISASRRLEIGCFCVFAPNVYVSDTNHEYRDVSKPIFSQGITIRDNVIIEDNCWIGINSVVMSSVGRGSVIGANSVVIDPIPPFCVAVGNPAVVKLMYNHSTKLWVKVLSKDDMERAMKNRGKMPSRKEYCSVLSSNTFSVGSWAAGE